MEWHFEIPTITNLQERGKYTFYANEKSKEQNFPERRRDFRKPVSAATINNYIRNLKVFFNWLDSDYILKKNPMKKVRQLKTNRNAKAFFLIVVNDEFQFAIGSDAFRGCEALTDVSLPDSLTKIGTSAFYGCDSLKAVYYAGTRSEWGFINIEMHNYPLTAAPLYCGVNP